MLLSLVSTEPLSKLFMIPHKTKRALGKASNSALQIESLDK